MASPNDTLIGPGQSITDAAGNVWTITASRQVAVNGQVDPTTAGVTHLAYVNGLVWHENTSNLWWSKGSPGASWSPPNGTVAVPVHVLGVASNNAVFGIPLSGAVSPTITDQSANTWTITASRQVAVNGVIDQTTANVIELAYINGQIWQENSSGLWYEKPRPVDGWIPSAGTPITPISGAFNIINNPGDNAIITVGALTVSPFGAAPPHSTTKIVTSGVLAAHTPITISSETATLVVNGASSLTQGATLTVVGAYRTPTPVYGPVENNGTLNLTDATIHIGALSGRGSIPAASSNLEIQSATDGNTIQLTSSNLAIGGQGGINPANPHGGTPGGMSFLAPITMDPSSTVTLYNTQATREVLETHGGLIHEVFLFNGSSQVADLKISGVSQLYAEQIGAGPGAMVLLSANPNHQNHQYLPVLSHEG
jgi:hypothetical protein